MPFYANLLNAILPFFLNILLIELRLIGGGGYKPKTISALQEDKKLKEENYFLRELSKEIQQRMLDRELKFTTDYLDFEGDINFNFNDDE